MGGVVRIVRFVAGGCGLAAALLVAGCVDALVTTSATVPSGNWQIERQLDRVTGEPLASAFVMTSAASNSQADFAKPAMLQLMCFKDQPIVRFAFEFKVGANKNADLGYRFDDKPGHEPRVRFVQDFRVVVIEDQAEVAKFVQELATSNSLYVRVRSLHAGRSAAEFKVDGAAAAVEAALAGCPVKAQPAPTKPPPKAKPAPSAKPSASGPRVSEAGR